MPAVMARAVYAELLVRLVLSAVLVEVVVDVLWLQAELVAVLKLSGYVEGRYR